MPSPDLNPDSVARMIRAAVSAAVKEATERPRVSTTLSGNVEDVSEDLDVVFVRMDQEAMGGDPTQSMNYESPGVIPATRHGEAYVDEQVRVDFSGSSGASANRTSIENRIVLPYGAEYGQHIVLDGNEGTIEFYDEDNVLVGFLDSTQWFVGPLGGATARLDPFGGLRLRDEGDELRVLLSSSEGLSLRDPVSGINGLIARADGLTILDPATGESVTIGSGTTSATPTPRWASEQSLNPGTTLETPAPSGFGTGDDIDLRWVCSSAPTDLGAIGHTPPGGLTEQTDSFSSGSGLTLASSLASLDPSTSSVARTFTVTSGSLTRHNGHSVIIRGGGATSPSVRAVQVTSVETTSKTITFGIDLPPGVAEGDILVAYVALAGPNVPVGWTVPNGWVNLGVQIAGLGTTHILGSGVWFKRAGASEPASETVSINMSATGLTKVEATAVAVQDPYAYPAGLDIRRNNRSMPRGRVAESISTTNFNPSPSTFPVVVQTTPTIDVLAGRNYRISFSCPIAEFATLSSSNILGIWIQISRNSGVWENFVRMHWQTPGGTTRNPLSLSRTYKPTANETLAARIQLTTSGSNYSILLGGAATEPRELLIHDEGAEY